MQASSSGQNSVNFYVRQRPVGPACRTLKSYGGRVVEKVTGIGGVFFKARDPNALAAWYQEHLGVPVMAGSSFAILSSTGADEHTVWATFDEKSDYFGAVENRSMVNYRVSDLDAMLAQLRAAGAEVLPDVMEDDNGKFGWAVDPEGNRFELWQPK
jgi:predicted enzyme related to lactoylglutathione lyase